MTEEDVSRAMRRLQAWLDAGEKAQDRYGYEGAGRMPIERDIRIVLAALSARPHLKDCNQWST